jgi:hypothetical protein
MPLGDAYSGLCRAALESFQPDRSIILECCNLGYPRGKCARFPEDGTPDAVRFAISGHDGGIVRLRFVIEHDHLPFQHGGLEYSVEERTFAGPAMEKLLHRQAEAYLESYLRRKDRHEVG